MGEVKVTSEPIVDFDIGTGAVELELLSYEGS